MILLQLFLTFLKVEKANKDLLAVKHMTEDDLDVVYGNV